MVVDLLAEKGASAKGNSNTADKKEVGSVKAKTGFTMANDKFETSDDKEEMRALTAGTSRPRKASIPLF